MTLKLNHFSAFLLLLLFAAPLWVAADDVAATIPALEDEALTNPREVRLRPGIELQIEVLASGKPEVESCTKRVSDNGRISLPLIGSFKVEKMTLDELRESLTERYHEYLREPQVMVAFILDDSPQSISPYGYVTVLGRVKKPGWIKVPPTRTLTVSRAIQQAGGLDTSARDNAIKITRGGGTENGKSKQLTVDLQSVGSQGDLQADIKLRPGDVVYVPEQMW